MDMDDNEEHLDGHQIASLEVVDARNEDSQREENERNKTDESSDDDMFKEALIGKNEEEFLMNKCSLEEALGGLDLTGKYSIKLEVNNEQQLQMQPSTYGLKDIGTLKKSEACPRPCLGWSKGRNQSTQFLKRVMSEASFMQGQVMVKKSECVQEVMSKREGSKGMEGAKVGDNPKITSVGKRGLSEENLVEVEVTIKQWSNAEEKKAIIGEEEMLLVSLPSWSLEKTHLHQSTPEAAHQRLTTLELPPKPMGSKANWKAVRMHQRESEALQHGPKHSSEEEVAQAHTKGRVFKALNGVGMHSEKAKAGAKTQSIMTGMAEKPPMTYGELHMEAQANKIFPKMKEAVRGRLKPLEVVHTGKALLQSEQGEGKKQASSAGQLDVKEVECECCGMGEECTTGYIDHVKGLFSGHWVCGLCAEAVNEEKHRLGKGIPMEEAVRTHMNLCKQFSSKKKAGETPDSPGVAHAVCHLLSRHLSDPTSPHQGITPIRPLLSRTSSCLPSFSHKPPSTP